MPMLSECADRVADGPGCALWLGGFGAALPPETGLLFRRFGPDLVDASAVVLRDGLLVMDGRASVFGGNGLLPDSALSSLHRGEAVLGPSTRTVLRLGGIEVFPHN